MKNGKIYKSLIAILMIVMMVALSSCATWDNFEHSFLDDAVDDNTIYIGVFEPQTGKYSDRGLSEIKGIQLANSIYNSVSGYKVELIIVDTQSSTTTAETAIQGLIKMNPVAIIGSTGEATSLIAGNYIKDAKIPTITPSATNPLITQDNSYYFRASVTESQMGAGAAEYIYSELSARKIGMVVAKNDSSASAMTDGFNAELSSRIDADNENAVDGETLSKKDVLVINDEIEFTDSGIKNCLNKVIKKNVEALFISQGTEIMDKFFTQAEKYGATDVVYVGNRSWGNEDFQKMMQNHPNIQVAFPYDTAIDDNSTTSTEESERFSILYENKYGAEDEPDSYAALGYDSYLILINAISNASSLKGYDIRKALLDLSDLKGATGVFKFDNEGNTVRTVAFYTIRYGKLKYLYTTKSETETQIIENIGDSENTSTTKSSENSTTEHPGNTGKTEDTEAAEGTNN